MNGWRNEWTNEQTNEWMNEWMNEWTTDKQTHAWINDLNQLGFSYLTTNSHCHTFFLGECTFFELGIEGLRPLLPWISALSRLSTSLDYKKRNSHPRLIIPGNMVLHVKNTSIDFQGAFPPSSPPFHASTSFPPSLPSSPRGMLTQSTLFFLYWNCHWVCRQHLFIFHCPLSHIAHTRQCLLPYNMLWTWPFYKNNPLISKKPFLWTFK